jgi:hypothetical protein
VVAGVVGVLASTGVPVDVIGGTGVLLDKAVTVATNNGIGSEVDLVATGVDVLGSLSPADKSCSTAVVGKDSCGALQELSLPTPSRISNRRKKKRFLVARQRLPCAFNCLDTEQTVMPANAGRAGQAPDDWGKALDVRPVGTIFM